MIFEAILSEEERQQILSKEISEESFGGIKAQKLKLQLAGLLAIYLKYFYKILLPKRLSVFIKSSKHASKFSSLKSGHNVSKN